MLNFFARSGPKIEKIDSLCPGRGQARMARAGEGSSHIYLALNTLPRELASFLNFSRLGRQE